MRIASTRAARSGRGRLTSDIEDRMDYLPIFIAIKDQPAVVVGGGQVAHRKVEWLLAAQARITVVAPSLGAELTELSARGAVEHIAACFAPEQLRHASLTIA